ncbi:hypothetical protein Tco_1246878 [Tanacetum coccineum]
MILWVNLLRYWRLNILEIPLYVLIGMYLQMKRTVRNKKIRNDGHNNNNRDTNQNGMNRSQKDFGKQVNKVEKRHNNGNLKDKKKINLNKESANVTDLEKEVNKNSLVEEEDLIPPVRDRKIIDQFLNKDVEPPVSEESWTIEMIRHYKDRKEVLDAAIELENEEDVVDDESEMNGIIRNEEEGKKDNIRSLEDFSDLFDNTLTHDESIAMLDTVSGNQVKESLFNIDDGKAHRPGKLLGEVNATIISLVPKINTPNRLLNFRPIACRQITQNIIVFQELLRGYNRKNTGKKYAFKIDLQKYYDTISWEFLKDVLEGFGFHKTMVK